MLKAEVNATVGNDEKVQFLMENFHIPRNRIFNSRDKSFVDGVMRETGGQGVDIILNSLSGELLHATWTCVAEFGTFGRDRETRSDRRWETRHETPSRLIAAIAVLTLISFGRSRFF